MRCDYENSRSFIFNGFVYVFIFWDISLNSSTTNYTYVYVGILKLIIKQVKSKMFLCVSKTYNLLKKALLA